MSLDVRKCPTFVGWMEFLGGTGGFWNYSNIKTATEFVFYHLSINDIIFEHLYLYLSAIHMGAIVTKNELIDIVWEKRPDLARARVKKIVDTIFKSMFNAIVNRERIELRGFGSFAIREYKPYVGRNPKTGEEILVKAKMLPFFKVGKELKEMVDN